MRAHNLGSIGLTHRTKSSRTEARLTKTTLSVALLLALGTATTAQATNFVVSNAGDSGLGTLRQAVLDANTALGDHKIKFALPAGSTITLTSGQIALTGPDITMQGPGQNALTISGNHHSRIFDVRAGSLTLSDMTLRDGLAQGDATNSYDEVGGAIRVGPLPPPIPTAQFSASPQTARSTMQVRGASDSRPRAMRSTNLQAMQLMQSPRPARAREPLALTLDHVALLDNRVDAPDLTAGGAVFVSGGGTLVVRNCLFSGNNAPYAGGAILMVGADDLFGPFTSIGSFDIADSVFIGNHIDLNGAEAGQGEAFLTAGPGGRISNSVFRDNVMNDSPPDQFSEGIGGALTLILREMPITIDSTEISDNKVVLRPGVYSEGAGLYCEEDFGGTTPLTISNSTISNNQSGSGSAIEAGCNLYLVNSTIVDNIPSPNIGPPDPGPDSDAVEMIFAEGKFNAESTLIANPQVLADLFIYRGVHGLGVVSKSLILAPESRTPPLPPDTIVGVDPLLAALAYNGGPTRTHALLPGSPAIDAGSNPQGLNFDQRGTGFPRTFGAAPDIGAFEVRPGPDSHGRP
jgi:hypothetical protein